MENGLTPQATQDLETTKTPPEQPHWDPATLYAAAVVCMKTERGHALNAFNHKLEGDARKAHKFVSINLRRIATEILKLSGDSEMNCTSAMLEMIHNIARANPPKISDIITP